MGMDQRSHMDYWGQFVRQEAANRASGYMPWQNVYPDKILTPEEASCLPPEPSPADRALDEFIARRRAKRDPLVNRSGMEPPTDAEAAEYRRRGREYENGKAIDRAMSQLGPHDTELHERIMPYRLESK